MCFCFSEKVTKGFLFTVYFNLRPPLDLLLIKAGTNKSSITMGSVVLAIATLSCDAKVTALVIKWLAV
jgi:hypothetical protein